MTDTRLQPTKPHKPAEGETLVRDPRGGTPREQVERRFWKLLEKCTMVRAGWIGGEGRR